MNNLMLLIILSIIFYVFKRNKTNDNFFSAKKETMMNTNLTYNQSQLDNLKLTKEQIKNSDFLIEFDEVNKDFKIKITPGNFNFLIKIKDNVFSYNPDDDFWKLVNITFAEGYLPNQPIYKYTAIAEVIRNRKNSVIYNPKGTKTFKDIIEAKNQFLGVSLDKYKNPKKAILDDNLSYLLLIGYIKSIIGALEAVFLNTNYTQGALGFNKSKTISPFSDYYVSYVVDTVANGPHFFWAISKRK